MLFNRRGISISFIAHDGIEAVNLYDKAEIKPDVILMDHHMHVMNGIEATKLILNNNGKVKIIFLSADSHIREEAGEAGACAFLCKPAGIKDILNAIMGCIE